MRQGVSVLPKSSRPFPRVSGVIDTELGRHIQEKWYVRLFFPVMRMFIKTPLQGAQTQLYCCLEESIADHSGRYGVIGRSTG